MISVISMALNLFGLFLVEAILWTKQLSAGDLRRRKPTARLLTNEDHDWGTRSRSNSASRMRARLSRLLIVPKAHPQIAAASS
jgi:hypothetical protein